MQLKLSRFPMADGYESLVSTNLGSVQIVMILNTNSIAAMVR